MKIALWIIGILVGGILAIWIMAVLAYVIGRMAGRGFSLSWQESAREKRKRLNQLKGGHRNGAKR